MPRIVPGLAFALLSTLLPIPLVAQADTLLANAAATITAAGLARHLEVLMADSMLGRDTPSRELDLTANYVVEELRKLGLQPFGGSPYDMGIPPWIDRYPLAGHLKLDLKNVSLRFGFGSGSRYMGGIFLDADKDPTKYVRVSPTGGFRFMGDTIPMEDEFDQGRPTFLLAGVYTKTSLRKALVNVGESVVLYVPPVGLDSSVQRELIDEITGNNNHVVVLANEDSATFAARRQAALANQVYIIDRYAKKSLGVRTWVVVVSSDSVTRLLSTAGVNVDQVRANSTPLVRQVPTFTIVMEFGRQTKAGQPTAPNVVASLAGSDLKKRGQYIAITAHMDRLSAANDNASGVAALLELARAFSQPGARPSRSIIFLVTSGSERNFMGSSFWTSQARARPKITINLDNIGRSAGRAVAIDGLRDFEFTKRPDWIAAAHPEIGIELVDGGSIANAESDHVSFVRRAWPALYVHDPAPPDSAGPINSTGPINTDYLAQAARLVFHIARDLGNQDPPPRWNASGRQNRAIIWGER